MDFFKTVTGKVVGGIVGLVVIISVISWIRMDDKTKAMLLSGSGKIISWLGIVLLVPWATFFIISWVAKFNTNLSAGLLVFTYTLLESLFLLYLFGWSLPGTTAWSFFTVGTLIAGVYNLLICDWIAEKVS